MEADENEFWELINGSESKLASSVHSKVVKAWVWKQRLANAEIILHVKPDQLRAPTHLFQ